MRRLNFSPEQRKILKIIGKMAKSSGYSAYLVGGPVRDLLLGRTSQDVDIVCVGDAVKLAKKFSEKVEGKLIFQRDFPNATVKCKEFGKIDFVTARREKYPKDKVDLPKVEKTEEIKEDLKRRDFTINAVAANLNPEKFGNLVDPFNGLLDCRKRLIRILHPDSFKEDPTRIFRAIRFKMELSFNLEKDTYKFLKRDLKFLTKLTPDRLWKEIRLSLRDTSVIFKYFKKYKILDILDLNTPDDVFLGRVDKGSVQFGVDPVNTFILALTENSDPGLLNFSREFTQQMKYVRRIDEDRLLDIEVVHELFLLEDYSLLYLFAKFPGNSIILENFFDNRGDLKPELNGEEIKKLGAREGPEIGKIMNRIIEGRWIGKISSKDEEIEFVKRYIGGKNVFW